MKRWLLLLVLLLAMAATAHAGTMFFLNVGPGGAGGGGPCSAFLVNTGVKMLVNTGNTLCVQP